MTRIDKANFRTICKRRPFNYCINRRKVRDGMSSHFLNGDIAEMVESSLSMREVRGSMPRISNFSEEPEIKKGNTVSCFVRPKEDTDLYVQHANGSIWNSTELAEKAISAPNRQGLPQKDVEGNLTLLIRESKTSFWHKQLLWSPPARHVNRKSKRLACEKHMDWWCASTKPISERYAIKDYVQLLH